MAGLFDAIAMVKRSLMAQQWAQMTTGHNISNVNTPGYTRQRADLENSVPALPIPEGLLGMGVDVQEVTRQRNRYIDRQVLSERQNFGFLDFESSALAQVETILGETSGYGLSGILDEFWACWSDLANDPENSSARVALRAKSQQLVNQMNGLHEDLTNQRAQLDVELSGRVGEVNQLAAQIATLNTAISNLLNQGVIPNDLMDQRDLLIDQLAGLANIQSQDEGDGTISIWLGGQILVYRDTSQQLSLREKSGEAASLHEVVWAHNNTLVNFQSGEIAGLLLVRDEAIPELHSGLDAFAVALVQNVNALHLNGYSLTGGTGLNFFNPNTTGINTISLSAEILQDDDNIAASGDGTPGNGSNALAIFNLQNELVMDEGTATLNQYYAALASDLGSLSQAADAELLESETAIQQLENWQTSAEGVSLDEEMANLVRFQQAYTAVAKLMATIDEMLTTLLTLR